MSFSYVSNFSSFGFSLYYNKNKCRVPDRATHRRAARRGDVRSRFILYRSSWATPVNETRKQTLCDSRAVSV